MHKKDQKNWLKKIQKIEGDTPFLALNLGVVEKKLKSFKKAFPECQVYYAVKSQGDQALLDFLATKVDGFDIASKGEFEKVRTAKVEGHRMLFSNPVKKPGHILKTYHGGVKSFAFDSISELSKIAQAAPGSDVYLRIKVSDHGSAFPLSRKFGANHEHAVPMMDTARDFGLNPAGLTFHVGSQSESLHSWEAAIELCGLTMKRLEKAGIKLNFIDIGGGFPAQYTERVPSIQQVVKTIRRSIKEHFPYEATLIAEPGRYLVAEAGLLVATVIGRESRASDNWLFLDVGAFNGMIEPIEMQNWRYPIFSDHNLRTDSLPQYYTLTGPTCDAFDTFGFDIPLPSGLAEGDRLYIGSAGAYTTVYASDFNGFDIPRCICI